MDLKKLYHELPLSDFIFHSTHKLKKDICREVELNLRHYAADSFEFILTFFTKSDSGKTEEVLKLKIPNSFEIKIIGDTPKVDKKQGKQPFVLPVNIKDVLDMLTVHTLEKAQKVAEEILHMHLKRQGLSIVLEKTTKSDDEDFLPIFRFTFKSNAILKGSFSSEVTTPQIKPLIREVDLTEWKNKPPTARKRALYG
jgi:hypothetical protein